MNADMLSKADNRAMLSELGATGLDTSAGIIHEEFLRDLQWQLGRKVYREMESNDAVVGAMLYAIEMLLRGVRWTVEEPEGEDVNDEHVEFVESVFRDMSHGWGDFIGEWMAAPVYGFAPFEIVWKKRKGYNRQPGLSSDYDDGRIGVRKLAIRHPDSLDRWIFDDAGGVQGLIQRAPPRYETVEIPIQKLLLFTTLRRKNSPEGTSLLRRAYVAWYRKKRIEEAEAIGIERELAGLPLIIAPHNWFLSGATDEEKALLDAVKRIGRRIRTDEESCVVLPAIYDTNGNQLLTFELVNSGGRRAVETGPAKEYYSRQIAMSILADVILIGHEQVGSYALSSTKSNLFAAGLNALLDDIEATINRHLIPRLMALNGLPPEQAPMLRHGDVETPDLAVLGEYVAKLAGSGMQLFPTEDGELEKELLRVASLPTSDVVNMDLVMETPMGMPVEPGQNGGRQQEPGGQPDRRAAASRGRRA